MKKILSIFCLALLLGACSDFLEEYSQDLSKVESYTDLDELLLGDAYLPVGRITIEKSNFLREDSYFQTIHYMSDELLNFQLIRSRRILWNSRRNDSAITRGNKKSV